MNLEPIDTSTTEGKIEVMRLSTEGRRVAVTTNVPFNREGEWSYLECPIWDWEECKYAIIAEPVGPKEAWTVVADGNVLFASNETAAISIARRHGGTVVRYVRADD